MAGLHGCKAQGTWWLVGSGQEWEWELVAGRQGEHAEFELQQRYMLGIRKQLNQQQHEGKGLGSWIETAFMEGCR